MNRNKKSQDVDMRTLLNKIRGYKSEYNALNEAVKRDVTEEEIKNDESGIQASTGEPVKTLFFEIFPDNVVWSFNVPRVNLKITYSLESSDAIFIEIINPNRQDSIDNVTEKIKGYIILNDDMLDILKGIKLYYKNFSDNWIKEINKSDSTDMES
jgi:hypothetical protein